MEAACDAEVKAGSGSRLRGGERGGQPAIQRAKEAGVHEWQWRRNREKGASWRNRRAATALVEGK